MKACVKGPTKSSREVDLSTILLDTLPFGPNDVC